MHFCIDSFLLCIIIPIKIYSNAEADKSKIIKENKNKSGIYMWENIINKKKYVGSAVDLSNRLSNYYSTAYMEDVLKRSNSHINRALLKNGHSNFSLVILEYCEVSELLIREKHYIQLLPHTERYNIAKEPSAPMSGRNHSEESKIIMSEAKKGDKNPMFGKNHTEETKTIMSDEKKGEKNPMYGKPKPVGAGTGKVFQKIEVIDKNSNEIIVYNSISEAAKALNISHTIIVIYFSRNQTKPYKGQYTFKKI